MAWFVNIHWCLLLLALWLWTLPNTIAPSATSRSGLGTPPPRNLLSPLSWTSVSSQLSSGRKDILMTSFQAPPVALVISTCPPVFSAISLTATSTRVSSTSSGTTPKLVSLPLILKPPHFIVFFHIISLWAFRFLFFQVRHQTCFSPRRYEDTYTFALVLNTYHTLCNDDRIVLWCPMNDYDLW